MERLKVLLFSSLFPNAAQPNFGVFVENRLRKLVSHQPVDVRVVAPVPWFPLTSERFGIYARFAAAPKQETRHGIEIQHPRFLAIPKIGMSLSPWLLYLGARATVRRLIEEGFDFDVIDAHYLYPDGVAAALLARDFNKPFVVTSRGTDADVVPDYTVPRKWIDWCTASADHLFTVSAALKTSLINLDVPDNKITVLRNGVDLENFTMRSQKINREKFGVSDYRYVFVAVGYLVERKGYDLIIEAMALCPNAVLLIAGNGELRDQLEALAGKSGVADRVKFLGPVPHEKLADLFSAADLSILASSREGWPNVVLESMACGTPVVSSNVGGVPQMVTTPESGEIFEKRTPQDIAFAIKTVLARKIDRKDTRAHAEEFGWEPTSQGQYDRFLQMAGIND